MIQVQGSPRSQIVVYSNSPKTLDSVGWTPIHRMSLGLRYLEYLIMDNVGVMIYLNLEGKHPRRTEEVR